MLAQMDIAQAWDYAMNPEKFNALAKSLNELKVNLKDTSVLISDIMTSDDYDLVEKLQAYQSALTQLTGEQKQLFSDLYREYEVISSLGDQAIQYINDYGLTINQINKLYTS